MENSDTDQSAARKCRCDGSSGTDCHWCQGTGYIIEELRLPTQSREAKKSLQLELMVEQQREVEKKREEHAREKRIEKLRKAISTKSKSGTYNTKTATNNPRTVIAKQSHKLSASGTSYSYCKDCHAKVKPGRLNSHKKKCPAANFSQRGYSVDDIKVQPSDVLDVKFTNCQSCNAKININNVDKHKKRCRGKNMVDEQSVVSKKKATNRASLARAHCTCTQCGEKVHIIKLDSHKKICRGINSANNRNPVNKKTAQIRDTKNRGKSNGRTDLNPKIEVQDTLRDYKAERNLDGSRDYYRTRKEQGRFGSHSMYDDMGDESNA